MSRTFPTVVDALWLAENQPCHICGGDNCNEHFPAFPLTEDVASDIAAGPRSSLNFTSANDLIGAPRPVEIVEGIAWAGCRTVLVSESGTGKTFVLLDLAASVSGGAAWHGRDVQRGSVAYLSFEGDALGVRLSALRQHKAHHLDNVYVCRPQEPLSPRVSREGEEPSIGERTVLAALAVLASELDAGARPPIRLIVIDTVRASLAGSEDSSEHVSAYLRAVGRIVATVPTAAIVLAHHAGWQDGKYQKKRERGSSAWRGNCDATLYLEADLGTDRTPLTLQTLKVRDGERPAPLHLIRRRVELPESAGADIRRGPVTSCVIESDERTREDRDAERAASVEATLRTVDLSALRAIRDYPAATSIARLQPYVGQRTTVITEAIGRLLRGSFILEGKRGQPYTLTPAGLDRLKATEP